MNMEHIQSKVESATWFEAVGSYPGGNGRRAIRSLNAWDNAVFGPNVAPEDASIAEEMDWLPTSRDQVDPFYGDSLSAAFADTGSEAKAQVMTIYKEAMKSLRRINRGKFKSGSNDFSEAAIGAALYCSRMAAMEVAVENPSVWCELLDLYCLGYWPCGRMPNGDVVVY